MFRKYIIVAMPSPMPSPLRRRNAEIPKQMPASSMWIKKIGGSGSRFLSESISSPISEMESINGKQEHDHIQYQKLEQDRGQFFRENLFSADRSVRIKILQCVLSPLWQGY